MALALLLALVMTAAGSPVPVGADTLTVINGSDSGAGSLRQALNDADPDRQPAHPAHRQGLERRRDARLFAQVLWQALNSYWGTDRNLQDNRPAGGFAP